MYLPECIKMAITTFVILILKLTLLDSAHIGLSIHAKIKFFFEKSPMVPFLIGGHKYYIFCDNF